MARTSNRTELQQFMAQMVIDMKKRTVRKNLPAFDDNVTIDYLVSLYNNQNGLDSHINMPMSLVRGYINGKHNPELCTPDRIDNNLGYSVGNISLCRQIINLMRGDIELNTFRLYCGLVHFSNK